MRSSMVAESVAEGALIDAGVVGSQMTVGDVVEEILQSQRGTWGGVELHAGAEGEGEVELVGIVDGNVSG